jgi:hypothetical protein
MPASRSAKIRRAKFGRFSACVNTRLSEIGVHLMGGEELGATLLMLVNTFCALESLGTSDAVNTMVYVLRK